jgi:murein DD-endopeptidase MepM/ murein hydrolase activator NlpD
VRNNFKIFSIIFFILQGCAGLRTPQYQNNSDIASISPSRNVASVNENENSTSNLNSTSDSENPLLDWPVDSAKFSRGFMPNKRPRPHLGIDLAAKRKTNILAAQTGNVIYAGRGFNGYGRFIIIEGKNNFATFYGHLDKILVKTGDSVERGQLLGLMGDSGRAHGVHLHFELRHNLKPVDPLDYLPGGKQLLGEYKIIEHKNPVDHSRL